MAIPKVVELDRLYECKTRDDVNAMLDELLGADACLEFRVSALYTVMGVLKISYCGQPLSGEGEYALAVEQIVVFNEEKGNQNQ
jgi:hypothetical protein